MEPRQDPVVEGLESFRLSAALRLALRVASLALLLLAPNASAAPSPWWQISTVARPARLSQAPDQAEVQRLRTTAIGSGGEEVFAARLEVGGAVLACLGSGEVAGHSADQFCQEDVGLTATETAPELQEVLESPYGPGAVEVTGGPAGGSPLDVITAWGVAPLTLTPIAPVGSSETLGSAEAEFASLGSGRLAVTLTNVGDAALDATSTPLTIADELPDGVRSYGVARARAGSAGEPLDCEMPSSASLSCDFHGELGPFEAIEVEILVVLEPGASPGGAAGQVNVSGANAPAASAAQPVRIGDAPPPFGIDSFSVRPEEEGGGGAHQAGSHPFQVTSSFSLNQDADALPVQLPKDLQLRLPPELLAAAAQLPRCSAADFSAEACPPATVIGAGQITVNESHLGVHSFPAPIFNLLPAAGEPVRFGLTALEIPVILLGSLDPATGTATLTIPNVSQAYGLLAATLTLWGVPGDPRHDPSRGFDCLKAPRDKPPGPCLALEDPSPRALLSLPGSCSGPLAATLDLTPWDPPRQATSAAAELPALDGCDSLVFKPHLAAVPTTTAARAPTGLDLSVELEDAGFFDPAAFASPSIAAAGLTFPEGLTLNPSLATGLLACTPADLARESLASAAGEGCPKAAKVGAASATSPLFPDPINGSLYAATPFANRAGDARFALYAIFKDRPRGLFLIQPLRLDADPSSGRLSATLASLPRLPLERFQLHFNSGARAPLTSPDCGVRTVATTLVSSAAGEPALGATSFPIDRDCGTEPFAPALSAGTLSNAAGRSSPFVLDLTSTPGEPNPAAVELTLPPGLSAAFSTAATCPEPATATAECPPDSRLGHARIAVGSGPEPLWLPQAGGTPSAVYLAGPYRGGPYSLLIRLPAQAGPFDLGTVVLRAALDVDPNTAQASVRLDGLPQILAGVPIRYRTIRLLLDRPGFIRNPTSCDPEAITAAATSVGGTTTALRQRFQAAGCGALRFRPSLRLRLSGALERNGHPSLLAELTPRAADANLSALSLSLPAGELLDIRRIRALCGSGLATGKCPAASRLGNAVIRSPLLSGPLRGPVYLRAPSQRYPDLLAVLRSGSVSLRLHGTVGAAPGGRLRLRLEEIPDLPLSRAALTLAGGRRGIIVNSASLCGRSLRADAQFSGHNGRLLSLRPALRLDGRC